MPTGRVSTVREQGDPLPHPQSFPPAAPAPPVAPQQQPTGTPTQLPEQASAPGTAPAAPPVPQDDDASTWRLGHSPWPILNLIVGDAKTMSECQSRINAFMRLPIAAKMPQNVRAAIQAMGFQVAAEGGVSGGDVATQRAQAGGATAEQQGLALGQGGTSTPQPQMQPVQEAVREAMGQAFPAGLPAAGDPGGGQWVSIDQAGVPLKVFISPGGTVLKGPSALIGANVAHLPAVPGERHLTFHPQGHIPPLADGQHTYAEHPEGTLPLKLNRGQSQLALVQALHDVASQRNAAKGGQAERLNAAQAQQMAAQGTAAPPPSQDMASPSGDSGSSGAHNPPSSGGEGRPPSTGTGEDDHEAMGEGTEHASSPDDVPVSDRMRAFLMDHVFLHQPELESVGRAQFANPNMIEDQLASARTPPEQVLALAQQMHMWHPAEGAPDEKVPFLREELSHALQRAQAAGAIAPEERNQYEDAGAQLHDWVQQHPHGARWPSDAEYAAHLYGRYPVASTDQESGDEEQGGVP